ncbi:hypothetical protein [Lewinella sp. 4G2]|uniref:hypothetical protein n=1 Tax=Lewinella sp. 4G2 TaxID=1803372 RepID=UPI0007B4CB00|nr:hypothetical protein [Lewinella sp. 4G2]OAV45074.1 hypothetical protein A3850_011510 [Lewinella sp. 4G2]
MFNIDIDIDEAYWGSWASIVGLLITIISFVVIIFVDRKLKKLKKNVMHKTSIDQIYKEIKKLTSKVSKHIQDPENSFMNLIEDCKYLDVALTNLIEVSDANVIIHSKKLKERCKFISKLSYSETPIYKFYVFKASVNENELWDFYTDLSSNNKRIETYIANKKIMPL